MGIEKIISFARDVKRETAAEMSSSCPWCGGTDRFRFWPAEDRYWCRVCKRHGDLVDYLVGVNGMSMKDALAEAGKSRSCMETPKPLVKPETDRCLWEKMAARVVARAAKIPDEALNFLAGRGIPAEAVKRFRLGWVPVNAFMDREKWGLEPKLNKKGNPSKVWLPKGLLIPCADNGGIFRLRIRQPDSAEKRYVVVAGSEMRPFIISGDQRFVCVVESELDAILLAWHSRGSLTVVCMGNAQSRPDEVTDKLLRKADTVLCSLDNDEAGANEFHRFWKKTYRNAVRALPVNGKDHSEMFMNGVSIPAWIKAWVPQYREPVEVRIPETGHPLVLRLAAAINNHHRKDPDKSMEYMNELEARITDIKPDSSVTHLSAEDLKILKTYWRFKNG